MLQQVHDGGQHEQRQLTQQSQSWKNLQWPMQTGWVSLPHTIWHGKQKRAEPGKSGWIMSSMQGPKIAQGGQTQHGRFWYGSQTYSGAKDSLAFFLASAFSFISLALISARIFIFGSVDTSTSDASSCKVASSPGRMHTSPILSAIEKRPSAFVFLIVTGMSAVRRLDVCGDPCARSVAG